MAPADRFAFLDAASRGRLRRTPRPNWVEPMLATLTADRFSDPAWLYERKLDGERCLAFGGRDGVVLRSRRGNDVSAAYPELLTALAAQSAAPDFIVDGEIVAFLGAQTSFQLLQRRIHLRDPDRIATSMVPVSFFLFDVLYADGFDVTGLALVERKRVLRDLFSFRDPLQFSEHRAGDGVAFFNEACTLGWEGLIAKDGREPYFHGRSKAWLKFKCSSGQELVIGGFTEPKGSRVNFGALLLGYYDGADLRYAGKVGTGFDTATLQDLYARMTAIETDVAPFASADAARRDVAGNAVHWVRPELVAQIAFSEWTAEGRLRHPRFEALRDDKAATDVIRENPAG
jgi:DNA ligase D-like protein (predicted ligase)